MEARIYCPRELWLKFLKKCKDKKVSACELLEKYIEEFINE